MFYIFSRRKRSTYCFTLPSVGWLVNDCVISKLVIDILLLCVSWYIVLGLKLFAGSTFEVFYIKVASLLHCLVLNFFKE